MRQKGKAGARSKRDRRAKIDPKGARSLDHRGTIGAVLRAKSRLITCATAALAVASVQVSGCGPDAAQSSSIVVPVLVRPARPSAPVPVPPTVRAEARPLPEGVPIPPKRELDAALPIDGGGLLLGSTKTEAWLLFDSGTVVVDKTTGCATESYPEPVALRELKQAKFAQVQELLARPQVLAELREHVGLARRFGRHTEPYSWVETAFTPDGRIVYLATASALFRSNDGARTFRLVSNDAGRPAVSPDGKWIVYELNHDYVSQPVDGSEEAHELTRGQTRFFDFDSESRAQFTRSSSDVCLDTFTLDGTRPLVSVCVPLPAAATGPWPANAFESVSPSGAYGLVKWDEVRLVRPGVRALTYVVAVVELKTATVEKTLLDVHGEVDDRGNVVAQSVSEGGGDHTYFYARGASTARKRLGDHSLSEWDGEKAWLSVWKSKSTLGKRRCELLKGAPTPP